MDPGAEEVHGFSLEKLYELSEGMEFLDQLQDFMKDFFECWFWLLDTMFNLILNS